MARTVNGIMQDMRIKSQDEFVEKLKKAGYQVTRQTLSEYNKDITKAPFRFIIVLANMVGCSTDDLKPEDESEEN